MAVSSIGDTYFTNYSTEANDAVSQKMTSQIQDAETDEEMLDACKQFESYLVQQMFKSMEESAKVFSDDDEDNSNDYVNMIQDNGKQRSGTWHRRQTLRINGEQQSIMRKSKKE